MLVLSKINGDNSEESFFESSNVIHMKYNPNINKMTILFDSKRMYLYHDVPKYLYERIKNSESQGKKIHDLLIKNQRGKKLYNEEYIKNITEEQLIEVKKIINEAK